MELSKLAIKDAAAICADAVLSNAPNGAETRADTSAATQHVITGDCLKVMQGMEAGSVDVVITSPPYNVGIQYRSYDDSRARDEYLDWIGEVAAEIARLLADDGALHLNLDWTGPDPWIAADVAAQFRAHLVLQNRFAWVKSIHAGGKTHRHLRPVNSTRFTTRTHEEVLHWSKSGTVTIDRLAIGVPYEDKTNLKRWNSATQDLRCGGNTWFIPYETVRNAAGKHGHPAGFPVELPRRCMKLHGRKGLVLDPFAGTGSTLFAAGEPGWNAIGIEIDEVDAETARKRLARTK